MAYELIAPDAAEQLRRWDAGETIWTIDMGGMGPGYEQTIQVGAIELTRDQLGKPLPAPDDKKANRVWGDATIKRIDDQIGFSGAQWGACRFLAYKWLSIGPKALHQDPAYKDRHIQVSNKWPRVEAK